MPDKAAIDMLVQRPQPAISADGTKPDAVFLQELAEERDKAKQPAEPAVETKPEPKVEEPTAEPKKSDEPADDTPAPIKRELTKLRNQRNAADDRANRLEQRLDQALGALEKSTGKEPTKAQTGEGDPRPSRRQFQDPDEYDGAFHDWSQRQTIRAMRAEQATDRAREQQDGKIRAQQTEIGKLQKTWGEARSKFIEETPDYEETAEAADVEISQNVGAALLIAGEEGPKLAYWVAQNSDERAKLNEMSIPQAAAYLGRIAERLSAPPSKEPASKRPPAPIKPLRGSSAAASSERAYDMESRLADYRKANRPSVPMGRPN